MKMELPLSFGRSDHENLLPGLTYFYKTDYGLTYLADSIDVLRALPDGSINLVVTSPPFGRHFKKEYGKADKAECVQSFLPFAEQVRRVLCEDGSFVLSIGGSYNQGTPTKSLYHFKLLIALVEQIGFHLAQECFWYNPAKMPTPAEWVTVRRIRIKESVEYVWWLSKSPFPKADNTRALKPYSNDMMRLGKRGMRRMVRPSGNIRPTFDKAEVGGAIPPNVIEGDIPDSLLRFGNAGNDKYALRCKEMGLKIHPARFSAALPQFFILMLTDPNDIVLDPFAGSNVTGAVAENMQRRWISVEREEEYLTASRFRFDCLLSGTNQTLSET
jgi:DNA modification methylase